MSIWEMRGTKHAIQRAQENLEPMPELRQGVFMKLKGEPDDESGTYTGVADALIANPADMIHHLLRKYGKNVSASNICTSGFGSFTLARTELDARVTGDFDIRVRQGKRETVAQVIDRICDQCGLSLIEPLDGVFRLLAWKAAPSGDGYIYRPAADGGAVQLSWNTHLLPESLQVGFTERSKIVNEVYLHWLYNEATKSFDRLCYVDPNESSPTSASYQTKCSDSQTNYGVEKRMEINVDVHYLETTVEWLRNWIVDMLSTQHVELSFGAKPSVSDLFCKQVFQMSTDINTFIPWPIKAAGGSWSGKSLWTEGITRTQPIRGQPEYTIDGLQV